MRHIDNVKNQNRYITQQLSIYVHVLQNNITFADCYCFQCVAVPLTCA